MVEKDLPPFPEFRKTVKKRKAEPEFLVSQRAVSVLVFNSPLQRVPEKLRALWSPFAGEPSFLEEGLLLLDFSFSFFLLPFAFSSSGSSGLAR